MRIPERRQNRVVSSRRGLIQPRLPARTIRAGRNVTAASNATAIEQANAGPTFLKAPKWVKTIPRKVIDTVAADPVITLPIDVNALTTAGPESPPSRK